MSFKGGHIKLMVNQDEIFSSKILDLLLVCDCLDKLPISIYLLEKEKFIYSNCALKKTIGERYKKLLIKGWDYWYSLINAEEIETVRNRINLFFSNLYFTAPIVLKYHIVNETGEKIFLRHEILLYNIENQIVAINYFFDVTEKEKIEAYFQRNNKRVSLHEFGKNLISPREKQVLKLVADGYSSKQIANKLFISNHTAISHRKNLIQKFHVKNTAQLIKRASIDLELW